MGERPLASFSLTQVHYDPHDPISLICAWLALLPQGLCIVYVTLLYTTREIEIALTFAGQLCCEALNWGLKRLFKEARPDAIKHLGKGYGMPSSHSQFVGFFAVYVGLFLMLRHSPSSRHWVKSVTGVPNSAHSSPNNAINGTPVNRTRSDSNNTYAHSPLSEPPSLSNTTDTDTSTTLTETAATPSAIDDTPPTPATPQQGTPLRSALANPTALSPVYTLQLHHPRLTHTLLTLATLFIALAVCASRIYLSYHTPRQVYVGFGIGCSFAILWFSLTEWARRRGWVEWVLEWTLVRRARVRDLICEEDLVELGWQVWEEKRRRRFLGLEGVAREGNRRRKSVSFKSGVEVVRASPTAGGIVGRKKKR